MFRRALLVFLLTLVCAPSQAQDVSASETGNTPVVQPDKSASAADPSPESAQTPEPPAPALAVGESSQQTAPEPIPSEELPAQPLRIPTIDLTTAADDVWERIRNGFAMPNLYSDLVSEQQAWYLNRPEALRRMFERARPYLYHIVEEIEKRGLPTELALLPMVESAFNPMAHSPARASGLWQFVPSTGRSFGLAQNWWIDERRDVLASTEAALEYLKTIYDMHGDWHLALASYNWGENAVGRAVSRNQAAGLPTDYASLSMPSETRNYVPKLQALKNIISRPELFAMQVAPIPNRPYFKQLGKPLDIDLALAARLADMPVDEFRALNPAHNRPVIRASEGPSLVLPAHKVEAFLRNVKEHRQPLVSWHSYTLKRKERLEALASRFGVPASRLREINGLGRNSKLPAGLTLLVPASGQTGVVPRLASLGAGSVAADERATALQGDRESRGEVRAATINGTARKSQRRAGEPASGTDARERQAKPPRTVAAKKAPNGKPGSARKSGPSRKKRNSGG
ncbi:MAG: transglycosylase SLT domain-containing protein [Betaproteobacteria bacterium]|nr:transglycosylase SLT domain-containing protein [Betaproteobacteria bacterium]